MESGMHVHSFRLAFQDNQAWRSRKKPHSLGWSLSRVEEYEKLGHNLRLLQARAETELDER